jgi:hypothetical protein
MVPADNVNQAEIITRKGPSKPGSSTRNKNLFPISDIGNYQFNQTAQKYQYLLCEARKVG